MIEPLNIKEAERERWREEEGEKKERKDRKEEGREERRGRRKEGRRKRRRKETRVSFHLPPVLAPWLGCFSRGFNYPPSLLDG